jgi:hypothetical protein
VKGGLLVPTIPPHQLFLGVQDMDPLADSQAGGLLQSLLALRSTPGYLGAWPKPGFLDLLPLGLGGGPPDANGYSALPLGVFRRQWDSFSALALDPNLLARVTPQLAADRAENDAQIRVHVGDVSQARVQSWVNSAAYSRARQASEGNVKLLHALSQQLGVPRDRALEAAEDLLDARLLCSLGGEYHLTETAGQVALWKSDRWPDAGAAAEEDYRAPLLTWFRGLDADMTMYDSRVVLHATLDMQRKATEPKIELPFFNNLFGGGKKKPDAQQPPVPPPPPPGEELIEPEAVRAPPGEKPPP